MSIRSDYACAPIRRAMATRPAGKFWLVYFSIFVVGVTAGLALWVR